MVLVERTDCSASLPGPAEAVDVMPDGIGDHSTGLPGPCGLLLRAFSLFFLFSFPSFSWRLHRMISFFCKASADEWSPMAAESEGLDGA